jgi:hypothetical protein
MYKRATELRQQHNPDQTATGAGHHARGNHHVPEIGHGRRLPSADGEPPGIFGLTPLRTTEVTAQQLWKATCI